MGFHWPRGARRPKPWPGGPNMVVGQPTLTDLPHFGAHRPKTWWVRSSIGGKGESEAVEAVPPHFMAGHPRGGRLATHLH
jgi:hypothetical protein